MENIRLDEFNRVAEEERAREIEKEKQRQKDNYQKDLNEMRAKVALIKPKPEYKRKIVSRFEGERPVTQTMTKEKIEEKAKNLLAYENQQKIKAIHKEFDRKKELERQREQDRQREKHEAQRQEKEHSKNEIGSNRTGRMHNGGKDRPEPERVRTSFAENAEEITKKRAKSEKTRDSEKTTGSRRSSSRKRADKDKERGMDDDSLER